MTPRLLASLLAGAALLAGCADPYQQDPASRDQGERRDGQRRGVATQEPPTSGSPDKPRLPDPPASGELPGRVPPELRDEPTSFPEAGETPRATLELAAGLYGNWTSANTAERFERIAALCAGQARAELRQAAAQSGTDPQQQDLRSRASVEVLDVEGAGGQRRGLVVTRQRVEGPGLPQTGWRYQVTVARLEQRAGKWVISRWVPQP